jgi:hypothetical protein
MNDYTMQPPMVRHRRPGKLPDADILRPLVEAGEGVKEIAARYSVTHEAVRRALARHGLTPHHTRISHRQYMPWTLSSRDTHNYLAQRLRDYSSVRQGKRISARASATLREWQRFMEGDNSYGVQLSVNYDRRDPEGFWLEPKQDGDGDYIHPPAGARGGQ